MKQTTILMLASVCLCLLASHGCKRDADGTGAQQRAKLEELQSKLDEAVSELKAGETERRAAELGVPTMREIETDLRAASALLAKARATINDTQGEGAEHVLQQARDVISFTSARLPRAQIVVRLARASAALSAGAEPAWEEARAQVAQVRSLAASERAGPMRVEANLDAALDEILDDMDKGDAQQAQAGIAKLLGTELQPPKDELLLARADSCINAAMEALARKGLSAAGAWIGDAERAISEIVTDLGGGEPAQEEDEEPEPAAKPKPATAAPQEKEQAPAASEASKEAPPEPEQADDAAEPEETGADSAPQSPESETASAATAD